MTFFGAEAPPQDGVVSSSHGLELNAGGSLVRPLASGRDDTFVVKERGLSR